MPVKWVYPEASSSGVPVAWLVWAEPGSASGSGKWIIVMAI